jgi:hypothetical protein
MPRIRRAAVTAAACLAAALAAVLAAPERAVAPVEPAAAAAPRAREAERPPRRRAPLYTAASVANARRWAQRRPGVVAFAVLGPRDRLRGWRRAVAFPSASVVKAMLMVSLLRRTGPAPLAASWRRQLRKMVTESDNDAALAVYAVVGRAGVAGVARAAGMDRFAQPGSLFDAQITAADQARLFLRIERRVPRRHRRLAHRLLRSIVPRQRWGVARVAERRGFTPYFKGGWRPGLVHQAARLERRGRRVALAVLTRDQPSHAAGVATLEGVAARVLVRKSSAARRCSPRTPPRRGWSSGPGCAP